ncbi:MAG: DUF4230 domain-containing protein [Bacteroidetes bacterium]|nr:MAG: DUF4230 domain-containing protein [Bacteroidota bacterium]
MSPEIDTSSRAKNIGRLLVVVLALTLGGILIYKNYSGKLSGYQNIPEEMTINYLPADFKADVDPEEAMVVLANPQRYKKEFDGLVYNLNMSILRHVANRMGLDERLKGQLESEYQKHHPYLKNLYYHDFVALKDTTSALYQTWYDNESTNAVEVLNEVASKYTCFFVNQVVTTLVETQGGAIFAKGSNVDTPCGIALTEALRPLLKRMEDRAAIEDFSRSKGLLQEKVERVIAELATMEVRDKKGINKQLQTKIWGVNVSTSDIQITAISVLKVGFRLDDYFQVDLNSKANVVTITLPEPVILSHEVYPKIEKLDIGWLREVQDVNLNEGFNKLRTVFRQEAFESDIFDRSKTQAVELMNTMFLPVITSMNSNYRLKVRFKEPEATDTDDIDINFEE